MSFRPITLQTALALWVVVPLLVALATVGYLTTSALAEDRERRLKEEIQLVARAIRVPVSRAMAAGDHHQLQTALESVFQIGRVYGANVYDAEGAIVVSTGEGPSLPQPDRKVAATSQDRGGAYRQSGARRVYSYLLPLAGADGGVAGLLEVMRKRRDIDAEVRRIQLQVVGVLLLCALGVLAFVLIGHRRAIGAPIERLVSDMREVGSGQGDHRARLAGPRELTMLAGALNRMLDDIARAEEEVEVHRVQERELEARVRRAEKLAAIGQLASGLAHELGTPLSVIDRYAQRVVRDEAVSARSAEALRGVRREVGRMSRIVRQLLDFGTRSAGRPQLMAADRLVRRAAVAVRDLAAERSVEVTVQAPLPSPTVRVDAGRCEHALANLLQNAVQAVPEGGRVVFGYHAHDDEVELFVEDDGPGIADDIKDRLFEPFFTTKATGEGSGLGLAVVQGVVEETEGRIELGSSSLGGARFAIVLPREET